MSAWLLFQAEYDFYFKQNTTIKQNTTKKDDSLPTRSKHILYSIQRVLLFVADSSLPRESC